MYLEIIECLFFHFYNNVKILQFFIKIAENNKHNELKIYYTLVN